MIQKSYDGSASLYLVPTPIGNLKDITLRALDVLKFVDYILCEDTRNTKVLLDYYEIKKKLVSCHEFNEEKLVNTVISDLNSGLNIALVSDQGTPMMSDPGFILSKSVINNGFNVISLPGATAFVPAITVASLEAMPFLFYGFLNAKESKQKDELKLLRDLKYTLVFYESVHRIDRTLNNILEVFGDRNMALCREISKIHEEISRGKISEIIPLVDKMKGEFVIVVEGNKEKIDFSAISIVDHVKLYVDDGITEKEAIKMVAKERCVSKAIIYNEYHTSKEKK